MILPSAAVCKEWVTTNYYYYYITTIAELPWTEEFFFFWYHLLDHIYWKSSLQGDPMILLSSVPHLKMYPLISVYYHIFTSSNYLSVLWPHICNVSFHQKPSWIPASWCNSVWVSIMRKGHAVKHWYSAVMGGRSVSEQATFLSIMTSAGRSTVALWVAIMSKGRQVIRHWWGTSMKDLKRRLRKHLFDFFNYWLGLFDVQQLSEWFKPAWPSINPVLWLWFIKELNPFWILWDHTWLSFGTVMY